MLVLLSRRIRPMLDGDDRLLTLRPAQQQKEK
jgi:hypothetical protein